MAEPVGYEGRKEESGDPAEKSAAQDGTAGSTAAKSQSPHYQFDFLNWFYWTLWWQQYSYWLWQLQTSVAPGNSGPWEVPHPPGRGQDGSGFAGDQFPYHNQQWMQYYGQWPHPQPPVGPPPGQPLPPMGAMGAMGARNQQIPQQQHPGAGLLLRIRLITGYETFIGPVIKRILAEFIDTFLFGLVLKAYMPDIDYRDLMINTRYNK